MLLLLLLVGHHIHRGVVHCFSVAKLFIYLRAKQESNDKVEYGQISQMKHTVYIYTNTHTHTCILIVSMQVNFQVKRRKSKLLNTRRRKRTPQKDLLIKYQVSTKSTSSFFFLFLTLTANAHNLNESMKHYPYNLQGFVLFSQTEFLSFKHFYSFCNSISIFFLLFWMFLQYQTQ